MPQNQSGFAAGIVPMVGVHVGAANAHSVNAQNHFAIDQNGFWSILYLNFERVGVDECFHGMCSELGREWFGAGS
jgi:hypothetical protein